MPNSMQSQTDHERLFEEICGKLNELSQKGDALEDTIWNDQLEKMQTQLRRSQDELKAAQTEIQEKIRNFDNLNVGNPDSTSELKRLGDQLEQERASNSKLAADLAKSLELNLKLQFEIEEVKSKANQIIGEERKHNQYLSEKLKTLNHEMELVQALNTEVRGELVKAKEKFQQDCEEMRLEKGSLLQTLDEQKNQLDEQNAKISEIEQLLETKQIEIRGISSSLQEFESHSLKQNEALKSLSSVAEKKIVELKVALDKKGIECQDYYSHLQQALAQSAILKQENAALKEYIAKLGQLQGPLHQGSGHAAKTIEVRA
ncbi:MAG: hypothetical protein WCH11_05215 [Bdellovibrio sp.]